MSRILHARLLVCAVVLPMRVCAQWAGEPTPPTRVRIWYGSPTIEVVSGVLVKRDSATIFVARNNDAAHVTRVPAEQVTRFDYVYAVRTPSQARKYGMLRGAIIGGAMAGVLIASGKIADGNGEGCSWITCPVTSLRYATRTGAGVTVGGAVIGASLGRRFRYQWRQVRLPW